MTALQPKFHNVTLVCADSLTIYPHKVILHCVRKTSKEAPNLKSMCKIFFLNL